MLRTLNALIATLLYVVHFSLGPTVVYTNHVGYSPLLLKSGAVCLYASGAGGDAAASTSLEESSLLGLKLALVILRRRRRLKMS